MTYTTQPDLVDRFGEAELAQRTDRTNGTTIDVAVLYRALLDSDAEIDGYLAVRYALPLASTPPLIARLAGDLARYRLYDDGVPEAVRTRYQDAVSVLKRLASGEVKLLDAAAAAPASAPTSAVAVKSPSAVFSDAALAGY